MHRFFRPLVGPALAVLVLACGALPALAQDARVKPVARTRAAPPASGIIVQLKDAPAHEKPQALGARDATRAALQRLAAGSRWSLQAVRPTGRAAQVLDFGRLLDGPEAAALAARIAADPAVEWAVPNSREHRLDVTGPIPPLDPQFQSGEQWWLQAAGAAGTLRGVSNFLDAWSTTTGSPAFPVAVLDTGITAHPELTGHVLPGYDFVAEVAYANDGDGRDADPSDPGDWVTQGEADTATFSGCEVENSSWHGTNIAGLIGASTNEAPPTGVAAINWNARILPVRVAGKCGAAVSDIIDGMRWAAGLHVDRVPDNPNPARIVNISFGGDAACGPYQAAIDEIAAAGAVVVAAAGNTRGALERPANCRGVVAVGAVNRDGYKTDYSAFGDGITVMTVGGDPPDVASSAPGDSGLLTIDNSGTTTPATPGYSYAYLYGTSFAAPLVSGAISLMLSANPSLTVGQIIAGLQTSARPHVGSPALGSCSASNPGRCLCSTATCGAGLPDAAQAVRYVPPPAPAAGGGGGALGFGWLLALALAVAAVRATGAPVRRRSRR